jgi:hypothetical protein
VLVDEIAEIFNMSNRSTHQVIPCSAPVSLSVCKVGTTVADSRNETMMC